MEAKVTHRLSITLTDPQRVWLQGEADRLGISVADLLRRIVDEKRAGVNDVTTIVSEFLRRETAALLTTEPTAQQKQDMRESMAGKVKR